MGPTTRSPMKLAATAPWTGLKIAQHDKIPGGNYLEKHRRRQLPPSISLSKPTA